MTSDLKTVPEYLKTLPDDIRKSLTKLRALICKIAPDAKESMQYGMPTYDLNGMWCAFNSQKNYLALYAGCTPIVEQFKKNLGKVNCGKSCIRFKKLEDLDLGVVEEMLTATADEARTK